MTELSEHWTQIPGVEIQPSYSLGNQMAMLLDRPFDLTKLNHESKVNFLFALEKLYDATMTAGEQEHTSDWDWQLRIVHTDEDGQVRDYSLDTSLYIASRMASEDVYLYTFTVPYDPNVLEEPSHYLDHWARITSIKVEGQQDNNEFETEILIDSIQLIHYAQI